MSEQANRLRSARIAAGFPSAASAAEFLGERAPTYSGHENGSRGIPPEKARKYARAFRVTPEWILFGRGGPSASTGSDAAPPIEQTALVPVYDVQASAGFGSIVDGEEHVASLAFPPDYLRRLTRANPRDLKIITVKGDSMVPTLSDDDVVMLDVSKRDLSYDGLFVIRDNGDGLLVKRVGRATRNGHITLISDNRVYLPVERLASEIEVIGKVIWQGRKV